MAKGLHSFGYNFASTVAVAQLVESRIVIPVVVGSSPISHPKMLNEIKDLTVLDFFSPKKKS
jgi:hypothetical protein